jgi:hypothetical protein
MVRLLEQYPHGSVVGILDELLTGLLSSQCNELGVFGSRADLRGYSFSGLQWQGEITGNVTYLGK